MSLKQANTEPQTDYAEYNFAQEVRTERLSILWRVTVVFALAIFWTAMILTTMRDSSIVAWLGASFLLALGAILSGQLLRRGWYTRAVWMYAAGIISAIALLIYREPDLIREIVPYTFVVLIFMIGLLLSPAALPPLVIITALVTIGVPSLYDGALVAGGHQWAVILLTILGSLVVVQVTGELYAIAEWALSSYRRERERKLQLHNSQLETNKALAKAEVLADSLEQANSSLEAANVSLEEARKAAEDAKNFRGQFLANMSHELRTPLNAVIGFSETMLKFPEMYDDTPLPEQYHHDLAQIHTSGTQLLHVINDILDLSKVDAGKLDVVYEKVDLMPIFKASLTTAIGLVGDKPVKLTRELPAGIPQVWGDANRIRQILLNIYSNAAKFTDEGAITLKVTQENGNVVVSVSDTGCGIHEDELEMVFEEFRQGRAGRGRKVTGSGLGLSISRHLIRLMNGRIWAESTPEVGSTFYFTLPVVKEEDEEAPVTAELPAAQSEVPPVQAVTDKEGAAAEATVPTAE